jgi:hypothetical protein
MRHAAEVGLVVALAGLLLAECALLAMMPGTLHRVVGFDYAPYCEAASRWLHGGSFYLPYQLAGPYPVFEHEILYPPTALFLLVPFTFLPAPLWWAIPTAITVWSIVSLRPSTLGWAAIIACFAFPWSLEIWLAGNPVIWIVAGVAAGTRFGWPAIVVALKPQFAPLALFGFRHRSFWLAAGLVTCASLLLFPLWLDWFTALRNVSSWPGGNAAYWLNNVPLLLIPLVAWLSSRTRNCSWSLPQAGAGIERLGQPLRREDVDHTGRS